MPDCLWDDNNSLTGVDVDPQLLGNIGPAKTVTPVPVKTVTPQPVETATPEPVETAMLDLVFSFVDTQTDALQVLTMCSCRCTIWTRAVMICPGNVSQSAVMWLSIE